MWLDPVAAKEACNGDPWALWHLRLAARPPGTCPDHAECPDGVEAPELHATFPTFPGLLVTSRHRTVVAWHAHFARGRTIRADPFLCWPAPLAQAFNALDFAAVPRR